MRLPRNVVMTLTSAQIVLLESDWLKIAMIYQIFLKRTHTRHN